MRYWHSSVNVFLEDDDSARPETVVEQMVATFVEQGWVVSEGQTELMTAMTTPALDTTMAFTRTPTESGGVIAISVDGPCAMTDGVDSPEVEELDGGQ
jgi:hypothetical protein